MADELPYLSIQDLLSELEDGCFKARQPSRQLAHKLQPNTRGVGWRWKERARRISLGVVLKRGKSREIHIGYKSEGG